MSKLAWREGGPFTSSTGGTLGGVVVPRVEHLEGSDQ